MNIDLYMEKNIARQIQIVEYSYEKTVIVTDKLLKHLNISFSTLVRDIQAIEQLLTSMCHCELSKKYLKMTFQANTPLMELTRPFYQQSLIASTIYYSLWGKKQRNMHLHYRLFTSKSSSSRLIQKANVFIAEANIKHNELKRRMILLDLFMKLDDDNARQHPLWQTASRITSSLSLIDGFVLTHYGHDIVTMSIFLMLYEKNKHSLQLPAVFGCLKQTTIYKQLHHRLQHEHLLPNEDELMLTTLTYLQWMKGSDALTTQTLYEACFNHVTQYWPQVKTLYTELTSIASVSVPHLFQAQCLKLLFNTLIGYPCFTQHYFIEQNQIYQQMNQACIRFAKHHQLSSLPTNEDLAELFDLYTKIKQPIAMTYYIVSPSEKDFFIYQEHLNAHGVAQRIHRQLFYTLEDVPSVLLQLDNVRILCDRRQLTYSHPHIIPISYHSLNDDLSSLYDI